MAVPYTKGLHEVAPGVIAYLQPFGGWGWSNAGLVVGDGESILVDTLFDLSLTATMLEAMAPQVTTSPITTVVNTHANGDHCYGNQLVAGPGVRIVATAAAAAEMDETPPAMLAAMMSMVPTLPADEARFLTEAFGPFSFAGIEPAPPTATFSGSLSLDVGGRHVELVEVGPAHTAGDAIAWLPEHRVVFSGDILFIGGTPIVWNGPVANWLAACERILSLDADVIVPGHGPLTDAAGVRAVASYLSLVEEQVRDCRTSGMSPLEATADIDRTIDATPFAGWLDRERIAVNVETVWADLEPGHLRAPITELFARMARLAALRRG